MKIAKIGSCRGGFPNLTILAVVVVAAALLLSPAIVRAADYRVDCTGTKSKAYPSISAALNAVPLTGLNTITVTGTCQEQVSVEYRDRLTIQGPDGGNATITWPSGGPVLRIEASRGVVLERLVVTGGGDGLVITSSSVSMSKCTIQGNTNNGLSVTKRSDLTIMDSAVRGNSEDGVNVEQSDLSVGSGVTIENNQASGVATWASTAKFISWDANKGIIIQGNGFAGVYANDRSVAQFAGQYAIRNNAYGVWMNGWSVGGVWGNPPLVGIVEENWVFGVVAHDSALGLGPAKVRHNYSGGVQAYNNATAWFGGAEITDNQGPGILADGLSKLEFDMANTVTNNAGEGIRLTHLSAGDVHQNASSPLNISGNGGAAISCDATSIVYGNLGGISPIQCKDADGGNPAKP